MGQEKELRRHSFTVIDVALRKSSLVTCPSHFGSKGPAMCTSCRAGVLIPRIGEEVQKMASIERKRVSFADQE
ncbi:hypothetical protein HPB50_003639 [Hyalomma asiaticum]|uniref:Uncharacterized protein n=1 Tax=Hyalomma asiaticum TaxID=266040 RepID=A0ACB7SBV4_HYAAI|nr:hypothetical protein HPB50_003639 [Hyalomma asiaticum]